MAAVYGLLAGFSFGALGVAIRSALGRGADAEVGALTAMLVALGASAIASTPSALGGFDAADLWPFLAAGAVAPGASQLFLQQAVRHAGVSRPAVVVGTAPLLSVVIALALLDEPFRIVLLVGTLVIVAGGIALAREQTRPESWRAIGLVFAFLCALLFATRDNVFRYGAREAHPPPLVAATASLLAAVVVILVYLLVTRRSDLRHKFRVAAVPFAAAGVLLAAGYDLLALAFDRGRVSIVAPLNATGTVWAVVLAALLFRQHERLGPRIVVAALLVVAGGALIGAAR